MIPWFYLPTYEEGEAYDGKRLWTYLCVCVPDVLVCGMFGCKLSLIACGSCASSYNGFGPLTCCSVTSRFYWRYIWMNMFSQWFILLLFLHGCISFRESFAVPYSCLLFSIRVAYAEAGLLVLMYLICSLCLIVMGYLTVQHNSYCMCYILFRIFHLGSYCLLFVPAADILYCWLWMQC
jgi:hypothetical protein